MSWVDRAACANSDDPDLWFPEHESQEALAAARDVCGSCEVARLCLKWALDNRIEFGIWGGAGKKMRAHILKGTASTTDRQRRRRGLVPA
jgi:WhiB family redox-sensing transcriptional regulator